MFVVSRSMDYCILLTSNLDTRYLNNTTLLKVGTEWKGRYGIELS